jgi:hypothetical protein
MHGFVVVMLVLIGLLVAACGPAVVPAAAPETESEKSSSSLYPGS